MPSRSESQHSPHQLEVLEVVLVEDDAEFRDVILAPALVAAGCNVVGVGSAAELYRVLVGHMPDVLVLDVILPDESGFEIARHVRECSQVGIIMLTRRTAAADHILGLDGGADAYLPKPVDVDVLCANVRSVARRRARVPDEPSRRWMLDADGWQLVEPNGKAMPLTAMERRMMHRLFAMPNVPVRREMMIADLTDDLHVFDPHRLDMMIHRLRRKAADYGMPPLPLRAVRGLGYVFVAYGESA